MPLLRWENVTTKGDTTYNSWVHMIDRCYNPNADNYDYYGGRGIQVCDQWRFDYDAFVADMGKKPAKGMSIDRIDFDGDYTPENCRWVSRHEQMRNRRNVHLVDHRGITKSIAEWAETLGVSWDVVKQWTKRGTVSKNIDRILGRMEF
jgi:hypothetical protein